MNIPAADSMVGEYLIYRGFTQTYKALESEKNRDKTKQFEVARIVEVLPVYVCHVRTFDCIKIPTMTLKYFQPVFCCIISFV